jgi:hypothetical protein
MRLMTPNNILQGLLKTSLISAFCISSALAATVDDLILDDKGSSITVRGCSRSASGTLEVPATFNGKPVTAVGIAAFSMCSKLTAVTLPAGVTSIGKQAFYQCYGLTEMHLPPGLKTIGSEAFFYCDGMAILTFPDTVTEIGDHAFSYCTKLQELVIPASVYRIDGFAFLTCSSLRKVTFEGNAPAMAASVFNEAARGFAIYCYKGRSGFTSPLWLGYPLFKLGPEIHIEQPAGSSLVDNRSMRRFGTVRVRKTSKNRIFTIRNKGTSGLGGLTASVTGKHAGDFIITRQPAAAVDSGTSTSFKVAFKPSAKGTRNAIIRVTSNDSNENPFEIRVTGAGAAE